MDDFLWLGNDEDSQNELQLNQKGINYVLNCAALDVQNEYTSNIKQLRIPADDEDHCDIINLYLDECIEFIHECKQKNGRILVHCMMGMNRSATMVIAYLMFAEGMMLMNAVKWVVIRRGWILSNKQFRRQLVRYAHTINRLHR